jgi:hypothetical protein
MHQDTLKSSLAEFMGNSFDSQTVVKYIFSSSEIEFGEFVEAASKAMAVPSVAKERTHTDIFLKKIY